MSIGPRPRTPPIRPLIDRLDFTRGKANWGYQLRFGLFAISAKDFRLIAKTLQAEIQIPARARKQRR
jgi:hypothetical protein